MLCIVYINLKVDFSFVLLCINLEVCGFSRKTLCLKNSDLLSITAKHLVLVTVVFHFILITMYFCIILTILIIRLE